MSAWWTYARYKELRAQKLEEASLREWIRLMFRTTPASLLLAHREDQAFFGRAIKPLKDGEWPKLARVQFGVKDVEPGVVVAMGDDRKRPYSAGPDIEVGRWERGKS